MLKKLNTIPHEETQNLVSKFFQKIITLKEVEHKKQLENSELQVFNQNKPTPKFLKSLVIFLR